MNLTILKIGIGSAGLAAIVFALNHEGGAGAAPSAASEEPRSLSSRVSQYDYRQDVEPLLETYCYDCHGDGAAKGELALDEWESREALISDRRIWKEVSHHVGSKVMPPAKAEVQPSAAERSIITTWIEQEVFYVDCSNPDPGRVTIRRLNRQEYRNTVRDLVGVRFDPAADFPPDDSGYGFDNIGDVLSISPVLLEKYLAAAEKIMDEAIRSERPAAPKRVFSAQELKGGTERGDRRVLSTNGRVSARFKVPTAGEYTLRVMASADQAGEEVAKMSLSIGGAQGRTFEVAEPAESPAGYEHKLSLGPGSVELAAEFINDFYDPEHQDPLLRDRNLHIGSIEIEGPIADRGPALPDFHQQWLPKGPAGVDRGALARGILERFATRAFRRPLRAGELERLLALASEGGRGGGDYAFERGIKLAMVAVIVSPNFLFRNEPQPDPDNPAAVFELDEFALASRLSYFLWSSLPDEELSRHARETTLRKNLDHQVERMLADPKSLALTENFAGQWLQLRDLELVNPDRRQFGEFDDGLRRAMRRETELFFGDVVARDRSLLEFLRADYTFANERLAEHYGIAGVRGREFREISLAGSRRGGVLTHGSILTLTSNPTRTSPVKRGKWILDNILGTPPPDPPANIPPLDSKSELRGTIRQKLEQHREDPNCAACHALMDPIGLAFENFDAIGRWREEDDGRAIDPAGVLDGGEVIRGPADLRRVLVEDRGGQFTRAISEAMLTYALGRGLEYYDRCAVDQIVGQVERSDHRFSSLILAIARSVPFQMRRGDGERPPR